MRLGILTFGAASPDTTALDALSERDVDLVRGEAAIMGHASARAEAERIARADCDGVALVIGDDAQALHVAHAAQFLGAPLLVVALPSDAFFAACGALAEVGVGFERLSLVPRGMIASLEESLEKSGKLKQVQSDNLTDETLEWLKSHLKTARQAGVEAVSKLYGQTLRIVGTPTIGVDAAQWRQQFGVSIAFGEDGEADMVAEDGNPNRALCRRLLHLVSGQEVKTYRTGDSLDYDATFAQLYRRQGKFHLFTYFIDSRVSIRSEDWWFLDDRLFDAELYGVPGDVRPALRAACEGLDINVN